MRRCRYRRGLLWCVRRACIVKHLTVRIRRDRASEPETSHSTAPLIDRLGNGYGSFGNNKTISFVFLVEFWTQLLIFIGFKKIRRQKDYTKKSFSINGSYTWERVNLFVYVFCFLFLCKFSHRLLFRGVSFQFLIGFCVCVCGGVRVNVFVKCITSLQ